MTQNHSITNNVNAAKLLLEHYGYDSLSYFALHAKKKYFFSSTGNSFLSYVIRGKVALVSGDPIGPDYDIPILLKEFTYFVKGARMTTCFVGLREKSLPFLKVLHHKVLHVGDEAVISLQTYNKQLLKKRVRRAEKHIASLGITSKIFKRQALPDNYLEQITAISKEWLLEKGGKERGFSMTLGRLPDRSDVDCEVVIALKDDKVLGYLIFVPAYASQSLSLDASRKKRETPNGLTEFLLLQAFDHYRVHGIKQISLNFATFYKHIQPKHNAPHKKFKSLIYAGLSFIYKTKKLYDFNEKFMPEWQSRYITFEKKRSIPHYLFAVARTELHI